MTESPLMIKSKELALEVIKACKELRNSKCEGALISQFLRSGTSVGANVREAQYAHGKADFVAKLQISLKECYETEYWLELALKAGIVSEESVKSLLHDCGTIRRMLIASINTTKDNLNKRVACKTKFHFAGLNSTL